MPFFPQFSNLFVAPYIPVASVIPSDISGLALWLKADAGVTYDGSNIVSSWADQSGNGFDGTATGSPLRIASGLNSLPVIQFDGANDYISGSQPMSSSNSTIFIVASHISDIEIGMMYEQYDGSDSMAFYRGFASGGSFQDKLRSYNGTDLSGSTAVSLETFTIMSTIVDGSNSKIYVNGTLDTTGNAGTLTSAGDYYLAYWAGGSQFTEMKIAELVVYDNVISNGDRVSIESYLNTRWDVY